MTKLIYYTIATFLSLTLSVTFIYRDFSNLKHPTTALALIGTTIILLSLVRILGEILFSPSAKRLCISILLLLIGFLCTNQNWALYISVAALTTALLLIENKKAKN
jgi:hypothetical protein